MKKSIRLTSMILAFTLIISVFGGTAAFADDMEPTTITFPHAFDTVNEIGQESMWDIAVAVNKPDQEITAKSSDPSIISLEFDKKVTNMTPPYTDFLMKAYKKGVVTLTFTTTDGTSISRTVTVIDNNNFGYKLTPDTTQNFSIQSGNSYFMKIHATDLSGLMTVIPKLTSSDPNGLRTTMVDFNDAKHDVTFRVDAAGSVGKSYQLYLGVTNQLPKKLCSVTITAHKNLRLDTTGAIVYTCNIGDTYRFTAYTNSSVAPASSANNTVASVKYLRKVAGGYEYEIKALKSGPSIIRVSQNGETASFPVSVNYLNASGLDGYGNDPSVTSDSPAKMSYAVGESYIYRFAVMGGGEPKFTAGTGSVLSTQLVKKDGINYYVKATAIGKAQDGTTLYVSFPNGQRNYKDYKVAVCNVSLVQMKSDTTAKFSVKQSLSYTFKITGAASFYTDAEGVFKTEQVKTSGSTAFYKITALGEPGQQADFYMAAADQSVQKVCTVTVAAPPPPIVIQSDTNADFAIAPKFSYQFKITAPGATALNFNAGTAGVFEVNFVRRIGDDFYYKIIAIGQPGKEAGIYAFIPGKTPQKLCKVAIS